MLDAATCAILVKIQTDAKDKVKQAAEAVSQAGDGGKEKAVADLKLAQQDFEMLSGAANGVMNTLAAAGSKSSQTLMR